MRKTILLLASAMLTACPILTACGGDNDPAVVKPVDPDPGKDDPGKDDPEPDKPIVYEVADPLTVKVAVVIEDPVIPGTDKRMHEVYTTFPGGARWHDPRKQLEEMERYFYEASHGVVDFEVVKIIEADQFFTWVPAYTDDKGVTHEAHYMTLDDVREIYEGRGLPGLIEPRVVPDFRVCSYDFKGLVAKYDLGTMRDAGEIHEIWLYTHPASCGYEAQMMGTNAFWINGPAITEKDGALCRELMPMLFCNYEREVALALHSFGHRAECTLSHVYGDLDINTSYNTKQRKADLTMWERFAAYCKPYEKFDPGNSNIGLIHFPPNGKSDYDYANKSYVTTYADGWMTYPDVKETPDKARKVNCEEWNDYDNDYQLGYMIWWMKHLPHFEGINPDLNDLHLNNWWHYIVDYAGAMRLERDLQL